MKYEVVFSILGFEDEKYYELEQIDEIFYRLKGQKAEFTLINPFVLRDDYDFDINDEFAKKLKLNKNNVFVLNILTLNEPFLESTVNFAAPVVLNTKDKILGQIVLDKYNYSLARPLKDFMGNKNEN